MDVQPGPDPCPSQGNGGGYVLTNMYTVCLCSLSTVIGVLISSVEQQSCWRVDLNRMKGD